MSARVRINKNVSPPRQHLVPARPRLPALPTRPNLSRRRRRKRWTMIIDLSITAMSKVEEKKGEQGSKVEVKRDSNGLGLSIVGGSDTPLVRNSMVFDDLMTMLLFREVSSSTRSMPVEQLRRLVPCTMEILSQRWRESQRWEIMMLIISWSGQ